MKQLESLALFNQLRELLAQERSRELIEKFEELRKFLPQPPPAIKAVLVTVEWPPNGVSVFEKEPRWGEVFDYQYETLTGLKLDDSQKSLRVKFASGIEKVIPVKKVVYISW